MSVSANGLMQVCNAAHRAGAAFPTIWETVLKKHPLVASEPVQGRSDQGPVLEVPAHNRPKHRVRVDMLFHPIMPTVSSIDRSGGTQPRLVQRDT